MDTKDSKIVLQQILKSHSYLDLTLGVSKEDKELKGGGGFSDVYCTYLRPGWELVQEGVVQQLQNESRIMGHPTDPWKVAVKQLRSFGPTDTMVEKNIVAELKIWARLSHPNVLPILGFTYDWGPYPSFVSPWMENGTLQDFAKVNSVDSLSMARGIASGLRYLHSRDVIHSDLKSANVLVSPKGRPLLSDFGLSRQIILSLPGKPTTTKDIAGSIRWMAAEFFQVSEPDLDAPLPIKKATKATDVWAFGMTILELLTGDVPYGRGFTDLNIMMLIAKHTLPHKPRDMDGRLATDQKLWALCCSCWRADPALRPTLHEIQTQLDELSKVRKASGQHSSSLRNARASAMVDDEHGPTSTPSPHRPSYLHKSATVDSALSSAKRGKKTRNIDDSSSEDEVLIQRTSERSDKHTSIPMTKSDSGYASLHEVEGITVKLSQTTTTSQQDDRLKQHQHYIHHPVHSFSAPPNFGEQNEYENKQLSQPAISPHPPGMGSQASTSTPWSDTQASNVHNEYRDKESPHSAKPNLPPPMGYRPSTQSPPLPGFESYNGSTPSPTQTVVFRPSNQQNLAESSKPIIKEEYPDKFSSHPFIPGKGYGPVLTPLQVSALQFDVQLNPLIESPDKPYRGRLEWDMIFPSSFVRLKIGSKPMSWRERPATIPRLSSLQLTWQTSPSWITEVSATDEDLGVTCGDLVDHISNFLREAQSHDDFDNEPRELRGKIFQAFSQNRKLGTSDMKLPPGFCRVDWLGQDTIFDGVEKDSGAQFYQFDSESRRGINRCIWMMRLGKQSMMISEGH